MEILGCGEELLKSWGQFAGFEKSLSVQSGDLSLLTNKQIFRASAHRSLSVTEGEHFSIREVWPDDRSERIRLNNENRLLRRDTLSLGESVIRSVGDTLPPFCASCEFHQNLQCEYQEWRDGEWVEISLNPDAGQIPFYYRVPPAAPTGQNPAQNGTISNPKMAEVRERTFKRWEKNRENGKKGGRPRKNQLVSAKTEKKETILEGGRGKIGRAHV